MKIKYLTNKIVVSLTDDKSYKTNKLVATQTTAQHMNALN